MFQDLFIFVYIQYVLVSLMTTHYGMMNIKICASVKSCMALNEIIHIIKISSIFTKYYDVYSSSQKSK